MQQWSTNKACTHIHITRGKCPINNYSWQPQYYSQPYLALLIPSSRLNARNTPRTHPYCNHQPLKNFMDRTAKIMNYFKISQSTVHAAVGLIYQVIFMGIKFYHSVQQICPPFCNFSFSTKRRGGLYAGCNIFFRGYALPRSRNVEQFCGWWLCSCAAILPQRPWTWLCKSFNKGGEWGPSAKCEASPCVECKVERCFRHWQ